MTEPRDSYSPERRTALLFTGTGADGAYHAGAMRAIQEAGVKIDVVGGRGIGAIAAVLGAVDGGSQLWDNGGFWRSPAVETFYTWRWPFMVLRWLGVALLAVLAIPAAVILLGLIVYPIALLLGMAGLAVGAYFVDGFILSIGRAFSPGALPTWIPRLAALFSTLALLVLGVGAWLGTIMLFNVWALIWPNQKKVLGLVEATADQIAKARRVAFLASRTNTLLSIPMLMSMVGFGHGGFFL